MMKRLLCALFLSSTLLAKDNTGCPQIDQTKKYPDGVPYCPESVKDNAFTVTRCAFDQAKEWHTATAKEKTNMRQLVESLKQNEPLGIIQNADMLKLQVCRSQKDNDSFLLFYTKPGVRNYSGPFLMYREGGDTSGLVLHAPHDGQDGTNRSTRDAFQNSNALALISNGHARRISGSKTGKGPYPSDWAHTKADLGYTAFLAFKDKFEDSVHVHIHGCAANKIMVTDSVGWDTPHTLRGAFISAANKALGDRKNFVVEAWRFNGWVTGLAMTMNENGKGRMNNERWVGAEVSVRLHANTNVLTKTIINLEADYLKKPRAVTVDLDKAVVEDPNDTVDPAELEEGGEPDVPNPEEGSFAIVNNDIKFAPVPKGNVGTKQLACVGVSYTDNINDFVTADRCLKGAEKVSKFYKKHSRGKLNLVPKGYHFEYPGKAWDSWGKAEIEAKKKFDADYYIIPNIFRKGGNHASQKIAHVIQFTGWVWNHEVGHLVGLGHTGKYIEQPSGKWQLLPYGDKDSVMAGDFTGFDGLTAPQYYDRGWLNKEEAALWELGKTYEIKKILNFKGDGLATVIIKNEQFAPDHIDKKSKDPRDLFLSYPPSCQDCVALHLSNGGGSQLIAKFKDEYYDDRFTGLHAKIVEVKDKTVRVTIDYDKRPAAFKADLAPDVIWEGDEPGKCDNDDAVISDK